MPGDDFDIMELLEGHRSVGRDLFARNINPRFARLLKMIGFDRTYVRGSGPWLWDDKGNKYLDCLGGYAAVNTGRNHPIIRSALASMLQSDHPGLVQFDTPVLAGLLAQKLLSLCGHGMEKVFFTNSGTEGVEAALKFARSATGRNDFIYCKGAFHGLSLGSLSVNGNEDLVEGFGPLLPGTHQIPFNDLQALEKVLQEEDVAAFIIEPIQGKGVVIPDEGYLAEACQLCHRHGALFIADEVQTGLGRTGRFLGIDHEHGVQPDMIVISKGLAGGYVPVGALLCTDKVWNGVFDSIDRAIVHASTFHMGPLAITAGLASLHVIESEQLVQRAEQMGRQLGEALERIARTHGIVGRVRQRGLLIGIELSLGQGEEGSSPGFIKRLERKIVPQAILMPLLDKHRVLCQVTSHGSPVIKLGPPLVIDSDDVEWITTALDDVLGRVDNTKLATMGGLFKVGRNMATPGS